MEDTFSGLGNGTKFDNKVLQTSHSTVGHLSTKLRLVRCHKCRQVLPESANVPVYSCGGCNKVLLAKKHKNDQDKCSLKHNNGGDPNEYAQSNRKYIGGVNLLDEVGIVLKQLACQRYVSVGRFFYSSNIKRPQLLGNGLHSWCGFYQSLKPTQMGLSLSIDMSATAFIEPLPVIEFVAQVLGKDVYSRPLSDADCVKVKKALRGIKVEVTHRGNMRRKYCISGLTSQPTRELIFPVDEEKNMKSVIDYFQEVYGFTIRHSHLPSLLVGSARKVTYLPMEACKIVEGQRYSKRLNDKQITSLLKLSCQRAKEQEAEILQSAVDLPDGGHILALLEKKIVRKTLKRKCRGMSVLSLEDHKQHVDRRWEDAAKSHAAKRICRQLVIYRLSTAKCIRKQLGIHQWPFQRSTIGLPDEGHILPLSEKKIVKKTLKRKCRSMSVLSLVDRQQHVDRRWEDAAKNIGAKRICRQLVIHHVSIAKRICRQHGIHHRWPFQQSAIGLPDGGHILPLLEKKIVRKTLKRKCRSMSVISLLDRQQHVDRRWEDVAKSIGDMSATAFIEPLPVFEFVAQVLGKDVYSRPLSDADCVKVKKALRGVKVEVTHRGNMRRKYCISGLTSQPTRELIFPVDKEKNMKSVIEYFQEVYGFTIRHSHLPSLLVGSARKVNYLPMEACKIVEGQRYSKRLNDKQITSLLKLSCQRPKEQEAEILQSAIGLPDGGHILCLSETKIVRKTLKGKCRSMSVLSLEDHIQHVDRRWEDAAKSHGAKRIWRQLVIHRLSTAKHIRKQHGIHRWPFQRSAVGLPDGGHILPLSEKKIVRKTLKRKCRSMRVLSLVGCQQHVDRRWEDAVKYIGAKHICRQLKIPLVSIAKRICRQHGIHHRWPFERDRGTMKGYTLGVRLSMDGKLVSRLQVIYISWLGRFSPPPSTLPGGEIVGHIALSSSQFASTNSIAQRVGQNQSGSASSDSENERTREQENPEEIYTSITKDDLQRRMGRMNRKDAAASLGVSVATFKRKCREFGIKRWPHVRKKKVGRPPDQHGERNTSTAWKTPLHNVHARMDGEPVGQNQEANEFRRDFMEHSIALNTENDSIIAVYSETEAARGSSKWAFQLEGQTMQSTAYPFRDDLVFSQSQIASTEVVNENMGSLQDRRDLLASQVVAPQKEPLLEGHVFGFGNWTVGSCSDLASSQTMRTFSHATGSSENLENWLSSVEEHLMDENVYGSSRSDPAPSQPMRTIHHTMATIPHMMPLPTERQDMRSVKLKATYGDTKIKFQFLLTSGINELKEVMSKILECELGSFKIEYKDEDGEWILMALDEHVREYLQLLTSLGNKVTELKVQDKVPNTMNFCDNCRCYNRRSLKRKRP